MNIENLTIKEAREKIEEAKELMKEFGDKEISTVSNDNDHPYKIGKNYLVRCVTSYQLGRIKSVGDKEVVLADACWVSDTGRFQDALENGLESLDTSEIELFLGDVIIGRGAIVDCVEYRHELPSKQK
jgi:hypothetical protein